MGDALFWSAFLDWHIRTDHPWDLALSLEAMAMGLDDVARQIGERLFPAAQDAARVIRDFLAAVGPVDPNAALRQVAR